MSIPCDLHILKICVESLIMSIAVIQTGGKQYVVKKGDVLRVEKLDVKEGGIVEFDKVLLLDDGKTTKVGAPYISGAKVMGKVASEGKHKTVIVAKYRPKSRYFKKNGHRQPYSEVVIETV
jgi:large subunit ribosomal protein L21